MTFLRTVLLSRRNRLEILLVCVALLAALVPIADLVSAPAATGLLFAWDGAQETMNGPEDLSPQLAKVEDCEEFPNHPSGPGGGETARRPGRRV